MDERENEGSEMVVNIPVLCPNTEAFDRDRDLNADDLIQRDGQE